MITICSSLISILIVSGLSGFRGKSNGPSLMNEGLRLLDTCDRFRVEGLQGYLAHKKQPPPLGTPQGHRLRPTAGS